MKLLLSPAAQVDVSNIWDFTVGRWGEDQAERYNSRLRDTLNELAAGRRS